MPRLMLGGRLLCSGLGFKSTFLPYLCMQTLRSTMSVSVDPELPLLGLF
jgi:hypothetical protein